MSVTITRKSINFLHEEIFKKCDSILKSEGITDGLNSNKKVHMKYGFGEGKSNAHSIKNIIFNYIFEKSVKKLDFFTEWGFRGQKKETFKEKFNGKTLYDNYRKCHNEVITSFPERYLEAYLYFLDIPNAQLFNLKYPSRPHICIELFNERKKGAIPAKSKPSLSVLQEAVNKMFSNSYWYLYSLSRNPDNDKEEHIVRAFISFGNFNFKNEHKLCSLKLANPSGGFRNHYGTINHYFPKQITFEASPKTKSKVMFASFSTYFDYHEDNSIYNPKKTPLFLGKVLNFSHGIPISYKAILHKIPKGQISLPKALRLEINDSKIPQSIRTYLLGNSNIHSQIAFAATKVCNLEQLGIWINKKNKINNLNNAKLLDRANTRSINSLA